MTDTVNNRPDCPACGASGPCARHTHEGGWIELHCRHCGVVFYHQD